MDILQEGGLESREEVMRAWTKAEALNIEQHQNFQVLIIDIVSDEKEREFLRFLVWDSGCQRG